MFANLVIALSLIGIVATWAETFLPQKIKARLNSILERTWYWLSELKNESVVSRSRSKWVFTGAVLIPVVIIIIFEPGRALSNVFSMTPALIQTVPLVWWISRSDSYSSLALRTTISAAATYAFLFELTVEIVSYLFIDDADDKIIWRLFIQRQIIGSTIYIYTTTFLLVILPVPLAHCLYFVLRGIEFILRKCIENNKGAFITLCSLCGSLAAFVKSFD